MRFCRPLAVLGPERLGLAAQGAARWLAPVIAPTASRQLARLVGPEANFLRWAAWAALRWKPSPEARRLCIFQIHGSDDRTFPIRSIHADCIVEGGGHRLAESHPTELNQFLLECCNRQTEIDDPARWRAMSTEPGRRDA
jgi:pimeloyl-ACP methyl ester carboxylesterase